MLTITLATLAAVGVITSEEGKRITNKLSGEIAPDNFEEAYKQIKSVLNKK